MKIDAGTSNFHSNATNMTEMIRQDWNAYIPHRQDMPLPDVKRWRSMVTKNNLLFYGSHIIKHANHNT